MEEIFKAVTEIILEIVFEVVGEISGDVFESVISHFRTAPAAQNSPLQIPSTEEVIKLDLFN